MQISQMRAARALLNWTQHDLADKAGLSQTGIARIENGTNSPQPGTLDKIHKAFKEAGVEFLGEEGVQLQDPRLKKWDQLQEAFYNFGAGKIECPLEMIRWLRLAYDNLLEQRIVQEKREERLNALGQKTQSNPEFVSPVLPDNGDSNGRATPEGGADSRPNHDGPEEGAEKRQVEEEIQEGA